MNSIFLTQDDGKIIGTVAKILGVIMNFIFDFIDNIGIPNIGLAIILFTIVVNLLMLPLTLKQQKFSKLSAKMNPEIQAIRDKYKGKTDNESTMLQNQEIQLVYGKYGVSPSGSCLQLLIQMPILFALYRVIYSMPAYVGKIKDAFSVLAEKIISTDNGDFLLNCNEGKIQSTVSMYGKNLTENNMSNGVIDVLNKLSSSDMEIISNHYGLENLTHNGQLILSNDVTEGLIDIYNNFLGLNIGNSPSYIVKEAFNEGAWLLVIGAIMIPVLSALTQWINVKLMPKQETNKKKHEESTMESSLSAMNKVMPLMSAWFCFTLPSGMGIYWITGSVVRGIIQVFTNKYLDRMDIDKIIKKNEVKNADQLEKMKKQQEMMNSYSNMSTKKIQSKSNYVNTNTSNNEISTNNNVKAKPGSMMAKANMVKDFNERNNKNN